MKASLYENIVNDRPDKSIVKQQEQEIQKTEEKINFAHWKVGDTTQKFFTKLRNERNDILASVMQGCSLLSENELRTKLAKAHALTEIVDYKEYEK